MTWLAGPALGAPAETYPLEKVRRGQTGYGLTTLAGVTLILLIATLLACWLPARRAAAIDPVEAIRLE